MCADNLYGIRAAVFHRGKHQWISYVVAEMYDALDNLIIIFTLNQRNTLI